jgi:hypothetical protein
MALLKISKRCYNDNVGQKRSADTVKEGVNYGKGKSKNRAKGKNTSGKKSDSGKKTSDLYEVWHKKGRRIKTVGKGRR